MKNKELNKWQKWVHSYGVSKLCVDLGLSPAAIYKWLNGECMPSDANRKQMVNLSDGYLCFADFYEEPEAQSA